MLLAIKDYMRERERVTLRELAIRFESDPDAVRAMLDKWIEKGKVVKCDGYACNDCSTHCTTAQQEEAYEWISAKQQVVQFHRG